MYLDQKARTRFFSAMGIEDDGRKEPLMTREEYLNFFEDKLVLDAEHINLKNKDLIRIYFEFEPYHDLTVYYCPSENIIYESRFYIGD